MLSLKKKYLFFFLFLLFLSCERKEKASVFTIGFSQCCDDPWRHVMESEMYRELSFHPEVEFKFKVANGNSELQLTHIQEFLKEDIDLLIVSPNEAAPLTAVVENAYAAGMPVILIDRTINSDEYTAYIGGDNYEIGRTAADYIASKFNGQGKVITIPFSLDVSAGLERSNGFRDAINQYPGLEIVEELFEKESNASLYTDFPPVLNQHLDAKIIFGFTDLLAETAYKVAEEEGRAEELFFVGVDGIPGSGRGIQAVEDGILDASLLYPTGGAEAIHLALSILNNLPYEKKNLLQTTVIDPSNARILQNQMKKVNSLQEDIDLQMERTKILTANYQKQRTFNLLLITGLILLILLGGLLYRALKLRQQAYELLESKNNEIVEKQNALLTMSEELQLATQAKIDFFTNISHEFRTPLTLILAFTEDLMFSSSKFSREIRNNVEPIKQNTYRLLRLVNQLMDFRKIESNKMLIQASEIDLIEFIKKVMKSYYKIAEKRQIDFKLITRHKELKVWFDPNMIDKALFNILSNAYKFTPDEGQITISVNVDTFDNMVKIKIEDNGLGMSKKEVTQIFQPFYQARKHRTASTGLGLPFSMSLVKLHHGDILVKSKKNKGSRFTILLPKGKAHFNENQIAQESFDYTVSEAYGTISINPHTTAIEEDPASQNKQQYSLLLIEDNIELLQLLKKKLSVSYNIITASTGNLGMEKAFETIPDLIICDVMLPTEEGLEITRILKADLRTSHIPIVLLTARGSIDHRIEGIQAGADAYIIKPFNFFLLKEKITNLLHNRQLLKEAYNNNNLQTFQQYSHLNPIDQEFIGQFIDLVEKNYQEQNFQITDLCTALNLSRSQLYRKIKNILGETPSDYIKNYRLTKAEELLSNSKLSISEIAYEVGYSSPDYFTTVFKKKHNIVPTDYRKDSNKKTAKT